MRPLTTVCLLLLLLVSSTLVRAQSGNSADLEKKVAYLLNKMTIEEKVGQMTPITLEVVAKAKGTVAEPFELDEDKLREAFTKYHVGSILNVLILGFHWS